MAGNEMVRERKGQGAKAPGSNLARERIRQGPIGRFAPGSKMARERKGSVPWPIYAPSALATPLSILVERHGNKALNVVEYSMW